MVQQWHREVAFVVFIVSWEVKYGKLFAFWSTIGGEKDYLYLISYFFLSSRFKKDPSKNGGAKLWHEVFKVYAVRFQSIFLGKLDIRFSWLFRWIRLFVLVIGAFPFILRLEQKQAFGFLIAVCGTNHSLMFKRGVTRAKFLRLTFNWDKNLLVRKRRSLP